VNRYAVIKKPTCNSCLNSYNSRKKVIKINFRRYYKVVTKLLQRANIGAAMERSQGAIWKKNLKCKEVNICSLFLN